MARSNDSEGHKEVVAPEGITPLDRGLELRYPPTSANIHNASAYHIVEGSHQHLGRRTFACWPFALGVLIGLTVAGAAIGGGLGAELASCRKVDQGVYALGQPLPR